MEVAGVSRGCVGAKFFFKFFMQLVNDKGGHMAIGEQEYSGQFSFNVRVSEKLKS